MLSPLQERVRRTLAKLPDGGDLALAGGAALIVSSPRRRMGRRVHDRDSMTSDRHHGDPPWNTILTHRWR